MPHLGAAAPFLGDHPGSTTPPRPPRLRSPANTRSAFTAVKVFLFHAVKAERIGPGSAIWMDGERGAAGDDRVGRPPSCTQVKVTPGVSRGVIVAERPKTLPALGSRLKSGPALTVKFEVRFGLWQAVYHRDQDASRHSASGTFGR